MTDSLAKKNSRLVVVSNRLPLSLARENGELVSKSSSGGLVSALEPLLQEHGGLWVGNAGTEDSEEVEAKLKEAAGEGAFQYANVAVTEEETANYYEGFSNEVIWPLFHDLQSRCVFKPTYWDYYQQVNRKFADVVLRHAEEHDIIWIQDYQLMQVAALLREQRPAARLAFFLHIPFPSADIFEKLPWRQQILEGLLALDLIGLQTERDLRNLVVCLRTRFENISVSGRGETRTVVSSFGKTIIQALPISIDYQDYDDSAASIEVRERAGEIQKQHPGLQIAIGVDRLDYTKGIPERLRAFASLLDRHEELRRKLTLIQVVVPSRENIPRYQELRGDIEQLVSSINGRFSEPGWTPIQYMHRSIERQELLALYRAADIALITPLKDGMNLVAKEYCAARVQNDGVLILSEFAGSAPELRSGALLVNPYDELGMAEALNKAFAMHAAQRKKRMLRLRRQIRRSDIHHWRDRFLQCVESIPQRRSADS